VAFSWHDFKGSQDFRRTVLTAQGKSHDALPACAFSWQPVRYRPPELITVPQATPGGRRCCFLWPTKYKLKAVIFLS